MTKSESRSTFVENPYAPTATSSSLQDELTRELVDSKETPYEPASLAWTAFRWFSICFLCAIPSFILGWGVTKGRYDAMLTGIFIFSVGYTLADYGTSRMPWRSHQLIRTTLRTAYGTRIAITILFPIGYVLDMMCGMISIGMTQAITGAEFTIDGTGILSFGCTLLTTLVQGTVMNVLVAGYGLVILILLATIRALRR